MNQQSQALTYANHEWDAIKDQITQSIDLIDVDTIEAHYKIAFLRGYMAHEKLGEVDDTKV